MKSNGGIYDTPPTWDITKHHYHYQAPITSVHILADIINKHSKRAI